MGKYRRWNYNLLIVAVVCVILCIKGDLNVYADTVISPSEFEDENLYNYIIEKFDINKNGQLEQGEADKVREINLYVGEIVVDMEYINSLYSVKGLEHLTNLKRLHIINGNNSSVTDISPIGQLTGLRELTFRQQYNVNGFGALSSLTELEWLDIGNTNCSDVSFLKNMPKLRHLELGGADLKNYECISGLSLLEYLGLRNCGLTDIHFLSGLTKLQHLDLSGNNILDFSVVPEFKNTLWCLYIGNYTKEEYKLYVEDIQFLEEMDNLQLLSMIYCGLTELPDLTELPNLTGVTLNHNYLYRSEAKEKLPTAITSRENWITETGMDWQNVVETDIDEDVVENDAPEEENPNDNNPEINEPEDDILNDSEENSILDIDDIRGDINIRMKGLFATEVYVIVKQILDKTEYIDEIGELYHMLENISDIKLYDITVYDKVTNEKVQPIGEVKVSIEIKIQENAEYYVFRLDDDGQWVEIPRYISDGMVHFYSDHFSIFSVVMTELAEYVSDIKEENNDTNKADNGEDMEDSDTANDRKLDMRLEITIIAVVVLVIFVCDGVRRFVIHKS